MLILKIENLSLIVTVLIRNYQNQKLTMNRREKMLREVDDSLARLNELEKDLYLRENKSNTIMTIYI